MLRRGAALADIACATGFADQAHLTRVFKTIMGVTLGQYRAAFQGFFQRGTEYRRALKERSS
jgi:AraC-like DNA-binding protein